MILTGDEITRMRSAGKLCIEPFVTAQVNPNSYNYRLGPQIGVPVIDADRQVSFDFVVLPPAGYVMKPRTVYLGHTLERLGSDHFAMSLIGRSSLGRLGLFLQISANLGHTGSCHQWTLELVATKPFRIYPGMKIGQISFWLNGGTIQHYRDGYSRFNQPHISKFLEGPDRTNGDGTGSPGDSGEALGNERCLQQ